MRRRKFTAPAQLSLSLLPQPSVPQIEADSPTLLQAIADLLLEALGQVKRPRPIDREGPVNPKITPDHLSRAAIVYVRQSTMSQVVSNLESQRRQYALIEAAKSTGFSAVTVIDDDLGRSGSGLTVRPDFQKLVAAVCAGSVGAVFCLEASRLARNGRDI